MQTTLEMRKIQTSLYPLALLVILCIQPLHSQAQQKIHSHNDYRQLVPFYQAYLQRVASIEVDIFYHDNLLLVGHDLEDLDNEYTISKLYLDPIVELFKKNGGTAWPDSDEKMILLVDLKSSADPALSELVKLLEQYPEVFNPEQNPNAVKVVISGSVPKAEDFENYSTTVSFDGKLNQTYTSKQLQRVAMISAPFFDYAQWNGIGSMRKDEQDNVQNAINEAHKQNKPIRFWASPDEVDAWDILHKMGVDFINTDKIEECTDFFKNKLSMLQSD